ncbi:MAG: cytochrome c [Proteobacteria bacterium]|jgi:cytochrome c556|nr:cytochrome c [Pseudomonadota bacterium]MDA0928508.1 cytochrome c [Pseudomonadota bacterium]
MKKVLVLISALSVAISGVLFVASAQGDMTPEQRAAAAVDQRKSLFKTIRYNLGPIAGMAQGAPWDAEVAERNARRIAVMATMIPEMLAVDTSDFDNIETTALDSIWDNQDDIAAKAQALIDNANAFADVVAETGDFAQSMARFRALGGSCGNCHDTYRVDND